MLESRRSTRTNWIDSLSHVSQGVAAWTILAVVETLFSSIFTHLSEFPFVPPDRRFTVLIFVLYPVCGLVLTATFGVILPAVRFRKWKSCSRSRTQIYRDVAIFTLVLAYLIHLIVTYGFDRLVQFSLFFYLLFIIVLVLNNTSASEGKLLFIANPWTVSAGLIGLAWIPKALMPYQSDLTKSLSCVVYILSLLIISYLVYRFRLADNKLGQWQGLFALVIATLLVVGLLPDEKPFSANIDFKLADQKTSQLNVILITLDTTRSDHLSVYGYHRDTTPHLREFAREATLYTKAIAPGDMTLTSHSSIFTGMYPTKHQAHYFPDHPAGRPLDEDLVTLAELLSQQGHQSLAVVANSAYLKRTLGLNQGFRYYDDRRLVHFWSRTSDLYLQSTLRKLLTGFLSPELFEQTFRRAEEINREVFNLLRERSAERPFFLFINYMDAHSPYLPPPPFDALYPGKVDDFTIDRFSALKKEVMSLKRDITEVERAHLISQYDGAIAYLDVKLKELFDYLKDEGLYDDTLIIVTSDHGESFGERNLVEHGSSVYQDQIHVPLIVKYPKSNLGNIIEQPVSLIDIMPTVLDLSGYEIPSSVAGRSLVEAGKDEPRLIISESFPNSRYVPWHPRYRRLRRALFGGVFKLRTSTREEPEFYDLREDPNEKVNSYESYNTIALDLEEQLEQWHEQALAARLPSDDEFKGGLSAQELERLRSLGYIR